MGRWSPLGSALAAFHDRGEDIPVTVRNDFGPTEEIHPSFFFRSEDAFEEWESIALRHCGARVLDLGAGVGAHALVLQARGHEVTAVDVIPEAVRIMRERGVRDAREGTLFELPPTNVYDTVILLMNGSMIAETLAGLDRLLAAAGALLDPGGTVILDSTDLRVSTDPWDSTGPRDSTDPRDSTYGHGAEGPPEFGSGDLPDDDYFGELHYQLSLGEQVGEIFPQLFIDSDTLDARVRPTGRKMEVLWNGPGGRYLARISSVGDDAAGQDRAVSEALA